jgi:hypothetical protein
MSKQQFNYDFGVSLAPDGYEGSVKTRSDYLVFGLYLAAVLGFAATKWCFARSEYLLRRTFQAAVWGSRFLVFTIGATLLARAAEAYFE